MRVVNKTNYRTSDLKKLFLACCRHIRTGREIRKRLKIYVIEHNRLLSRASYYGDWAKIVINDYVKNPPEGFVRKLAWISCHEFLHSRGISHRKMWSRYNFYHSTWDYKNGEMDWADNYVIRLKETKAKPKLDLQLVRYGKVLGKVKEITSKLKRYKNLLRKYLVRQRRYEKVLTASGKLKK